MKFIAIKTDDGRIKGEITFYCHMLKVSREGFRKYLKNKDKPWKYDALAEEMKKINSEDECNDTYGRIRMFQALMLKNPEGIKIPSERTIYRVMEEIGLSHRPKHKPNGITKADRKARKSDDLLKRDFRSDKPLVKAVTDITETKCKDGKLYTSAIFDCYDLSVLGLAMDTNMKAPLCAQTVQNAVLAYPEIKGCIIHSDRGTQYTSELYRKELNKHKIIQSWIVILRKASIINIHDTCFSLVESSVMNQSFQSVIFTAAEFDIGQHTKAVFEGNFFHFWIIKLITKCICHGTKAHFN